MTRWLAFFGFLGMGAFLAFQHQPGVMGSMTASASSVVPLETMAPACPETAQQTLALKTDHHAQAWTQLDSASKSIRVLVDTGASMTTLTAEDADQIGIGANRAGRQKARFSTANGDVTAELDRLYHVRVGTLCIPVLEVAILPRQAARYSLLGMNFMKKLSKVEFGRGQLLLTQ